MEDSSGSGFSKCGGPVNPFLEQSNGSTTVGIGNRRVDKVQSWTALNYRQRTLWFVYQKMKTVALKNNIPNNVLAQAKGLYKALSEKKVITRAKPKIALEATCFYKACNIHGLGRTHKEVAHMFGVEIPYMTDAINNFNSLMMDTVHRKVLHKSEINTVPAYIERYCDLLMMGKNHVIVANAIASNTILMGILCESIPTSIAVASLYFMIRFYRLHLPIEAILERLVLNRSGIVFDKASILKKKTPEKELLAVLTHQSDVTIGKTYKRLAKHGKIITHNITVSPNILCIKPTDVRPKFIH